MLKLKHQQLNNHRLRHRRHPQVTLQRELTNRQRRLIKLLRPLISQHHRHELIFGITQ
jgi:hypothetical protein